MHDGDSFEKIEPTLNLGSDDQYEYYIFRPDVDVVKLSMGVHPYVVPFMTAEYEGQTFHVIKNELWNKGETGVDVKGIFVVFFRLKKEFKGYGF
jgi:hypothetical protein